MSRGSLQKNLALKAEKMNDSLYSEFLAVNQKHFYQIWKKAQKGIHVTIIKEEKHFAKIAPYL